MKTTRLLTIAAVAVASAITWASHSSRPARSDTPVKPATAFAALPAVRMPEPAPPAKPAPPAGLTATEWESVTAQIRAGQRAFQQAPGQQLHALGPAGETLHLAPDGTAVISLGKRQPPADLKRSKDQVVATARVSQDQGPAVSLSLRTMAAGREKRRRPVSAAPAVASDKHLAERNAGPGLTEWWRSEERGFEFGWNLAAGPEGDGALTVEMAVDCPWPGAVEAGGKVVAFADPAGSGWRLVCRELVANDATGRPLPATMVLAGNTLTFQVDDRAAEYPVVIDPWIVAEFPVTVNAPAPATDGGFGHAVTLSGDTLAVTSGETNQTDSFHIFTRQGSGYILRRSVPFLFSLGPYLTGYPAAICGDTVVAGPFFSLVPVPGGLGSYYAVFERNAGGSNAWASVQEFPFTAPNGSEYQPTAVALEADTMVLGFAGAAGLEEKDRVKVYQRNPANPSNWIPGPELAGADLTGMEFFGLSVNMDGPTLVVGGVVGQELRLTVFRESGGGWQFERSIPQAVSFALGFPPVSLSGDTVAVGMSFTSEVRLFERDAGGPNQWGLLRSLSGPASSSFGRALSLEGDLLVVGSPEEDIDHDANAATPAIGKAGALRSYGRHTGGYNAWGQTGIIHKGAAAKAGGLFGAALSVRCGRLAVGYYNGDSVVPAVADAGVVEIYTAASGTDLRLTVANPFGANGMDFGTAVALDGPYLLVGAPLYNPAIPGAASGAAFLFRDRVLVKQWLGQTMGDHFGRAVALERDRIAIGAPLRAGTVGGVDFDDLGTVYIYERNRGGAENWGEAKVLIPSVSQFSPSPQFGSSLALSGEGLVVGSPYETSPVILGGAGTGRARIFQRNQGGADNWGQVKFLLGLDAGTSERFGSSVDMSGDTVTVGAPMEAVNTLDFAGGVYLFRRNQGGADVWGRVLRLTAPNPAATALFGAAVSLDGNLLAVSAPREARGAAPNAGAVYLYSTGSPNYDLWSLDSRIQPDDLVANHNFGQSIGLSRGFLVAGGPNSSAPEPSAAAVWLYGKTGPAASPWEPAAKLTTTDPDDLGTSVAIDGAHFVAGDPAADVMDGAILQPNRGEVYEWTQLSREWAPLRSRPGQAGAAALGASVALLDDLLVAGAPGETSGGQNAAGAAYVFRKGDLALGGWLLEQRLTDLGGNVADAGFGSSVAMDAQWLAVGSPGGRRASLFTRGGVLSPSRPWTGTGTLTVSPVQADQFGASMAMADGRLLVGAPQRSGGGAAFLFERNQGGENQWGQIDILTAGDAAAGDAFGSAVALHAGLAVVGAPLDDHAAGVDAGSVYIFSRNTGGGDAWGQLKKLTLATQAAGDELGRSVALADFLILAGMPGDDTSAGTNAGSAVLFARNFGGAENYGLIRTFTAPDGNGQSRFGTAVALDTNHAIVTAPFADPGGRTNTGELYIYSRNYGGTDSWGLLQVSAPEELPAGSQFGMAVAIDQTTFAAGAPLTPMGPAQGVVEIFTFRARTLYDEWAAGWSLHGSNADPMADADGDGQENILEMFFGTDPGDSGSSGTVGTRTGGGYLIVTFPKASPCEGTGVLTAETSLDLQSWTPASPAMILQDSASLLQIQVPLTMPGRNFVRFRAGVP